MRRTVRTAKWILILFSLAWMGAIGWHEFENRTPPETAAVRERLLEQKLKDCRGQYSARYDCKAELLRDQGSDTTLAWARRLGLIFVPPLVLALIYGMLNRRHEERRESKRNRLRLERKERAAAEARQQAITDEQHQIEEIRRRAALQQKLREE